jgi:hypothetical protein
MSTVCIHSHDEPVDAEVGLLCAPHYARLRSQLLALPPIAGWLHAHLAAGGPPGERVSGTREDPIPLRVDLLDMIGPDSSRYVPPAVDRDERGRPVEPGFLLWIDGHAQARFDTWRSAVVVMTASMCDAGVDELVIDTLVEKHTHEEIHDRHVEHPELAGLLEAARTRWQVRPTSRGGWDQAGVDAMRAVVAYWAKLTAVDGGFRWVDRDDLVGLVEWLSSRLTWVAAQPWVDDVVSDVAAVHRHAHRLVPWRAETRRDPHPCSRCKRPTVVLHIAAGESRCERKAGGCGRREPLSDYELNVLLPKSRRSA